MTYQGQYGNTAIMRGILRVLSSCPSTFILQGILRFAQDDILRGILRLLSSPHFCHPEPKAKDPPQAQEVPFANAQRARRLQSVNAGLHRTASNEIALRIPYNAPMECFVYILTNERGNVMYIGVTSDLRRRLYEHKTGAFEGFTKRYNVHKLVYYEETSDIREAIAREKQLKGWSRAKKNALVESMNPEWRDLSEGWTEAERS